MVSASAVARASAVAVASAGPGRLYRGRSQCRCQCRCPLTLPAPMPVPVSDPPISALVSNKKPLKSTLVASARSRRARNQTSIYPKAVWCLRFGVIVLREDLHCSKETSQEQRWLLRQRDEASRSKGCSSSLRLSVRSVDSKQGCVLMNTCLASRLNRSSLVTCVGLRKLIVNDYFSAARLRLCERACCGSGRPREGLVTIGDGNG